MAAISEEARVPLLASQDSHLHDEFGDLQEDDWEVRYPLKDPMPYRVDKATDGAKTSHLQGAGSSNGGLKRVGSEQVTAPHSRKKKQYSGSEMVVAVFVVAFDTKKG